MTSTNEVLRASWQGPRSRPIPRGGTDVMDRTCCLVDGCGRPANTRQLCTRHYQQARKGVIPLPPPMRPTLPPQRVINKLAKPTASLIERLWRSFERVPGGCWEWRAWRNNKGYGYFAVTPKRQMLAHRAMYEVLVEPIPEGLTIDHLCRNTSCVNPAHLEPVTFAENFRRSGRAADSDPSIAPRPLP